MVPVSYMWAYVGKWEVCPRSEILSSQLLELLAAAQHCTTLGVDAIYDCIVSKCLNASAGVTGRCGTEFMYSFQPQLQAIGEWQSWAAQVSLTNCTHAMQSMKWTPPQPQRKSQVGFGVWGDQAVKG